MNRAIISDEVLARVRVEFRFGERRTCPSVNAVHTERINVVPTSGESEDSRRPNLDVRPTAIATREK
jgi:hypothetical protein